MIAPSANAAQGLGIDIEVVLDNTSDAVVCLDHSWRYVYVNHAAELLLRRKGDSLLGQLHWEVYPDLLGTPAEQTLRVTLDSGRATTFEQFIPGLYAWHSVKAVPTGQHVLLFLRDVTDRVRALRDEAVREGMRSMLEHVPVAITITRGAEHRIELQNRRSRDLLNGRCAEGDTVAKALPEAESQGFVALLDQVFSTGQEFNGANLPLSYDRDGTSSPYTSYFDVTYQPIFDTDGRVSGILHMGVDVTERQREQELLVRYAAERDATLRQLSEGVILADPCGRITFVNERARQLHGVAVLGVDVDAYAETYQLLTLDGSPFPPEELPLARAALRDEFVNGAVWRIRRPDGTEVVVEGSAQPVFLEQAKKIACVLVMRPVDG